MKEFDSTEWPEDVEARLKYMNAIVSQVFRNSAFDSERNWTEKEKCINIYPKGVDHRTRNRQAAIWPLKEKIHVLVKTPIYEMIYSRVNALGIKEAVLKGTEFRYENLSLENASLILQTIAEIEW